MNIKSTGISVSKGTITIRLPKVDMEMVSDQFWKAEEQVSQIATDIWEVGQAGWEASKVGAEKSKSGAVAGLQTAVPGIGLKHGKAWKQKFEAGTLEENRWSKYANLGIGVGQAAGFAGAALAGVSLVSGFPGAAAALGMGSVAGFALAGGSGFALGTQFSEHIESKKAPNGGELPSFPELAHQMKIGAVAAALPGVGVLAVSPTADTSAPYTAAGVAAGQLALFTALLHGSSLSKAGLLAIGLGALGGAVNAVVMNDKP